MVDVARANMFGFPVGTFRWDERYGIVQFEYDHSFVGRGLEPSPLMMPVQEGRVYSFADLDRETFKCKKRSISTHPKRGYPFTFLTRSS